MDKFLNSSQCDTFWVRWGCFPLNVFSEILTQLFSHQPHLLAHMRGSFQKTFLGHLMYMYMHICLWLRVCTCTCICTGRWLGIDTATYYTIIRHTTAKQEQAFS